MPCRPKSICRQPGCHALTDGPGYCSKHEQQASGWARSSTKSTTERGYGYAWQKKRERILARDCGLCQPCRRQGRVTPANDVDHIVQKADGGTDDDENLQSICHDCHKAKTIAERRRGGGHISFPKWRPTPNPNFPLPGGRNMIAKTSRQQGAFTAGSGSSRPHNLVKKIIPDTSARKRGSIGR